MNLNKFPNLLTETKKILNNSVRTNTNILPFIIAPTLFHFFTLIFTDYPLSRGKKNRLQIFLYIFLLNIYFLK